MSERIIMITGASRGIGAGIAEVLNQGSSTMILTAQSESGLNVLQSKYPNHHVYALNLGDPSSVDSVLHSMKEADHMPDVLINNAGITADQLMLRMSREHWNQVMEVNLNGTFALTQGILKSMLKKRWGRLVFLSSIVGFTGNAGQANYAASKAALVGFSKSIALESARRGVTSNVVAPGLIETEMVAKMPELERKRLLESVPMARMGTPHEVAKLIEFIIGEDSSYITGHSFHINGGWY